MIATAQLASEVVLECAPGADESEDDADSFEVDGVRASDDMPQARKPQAGLRDAERPVAALEIAIADRPAASAMPQSVRAASKRPKTVRRSRVRLRNAGVSETSQKSNDVSQRRADRTAWKSRWTVYRDRRQRTTRGPAGKSRLAAQMAAFSHEAFGADLARRQPSETTA